MAASQVAFAWFVQQATLAVAVVGSVMGLVRPVLCSPVNREIKLMMSSAIIVRVIPNAFLSALCLLRAGCCVFAKILLIVVSLSVVGTEILLIVASSSVFGTEFLLIVASSSVSVTVVGGSMMGAVVCMRC